MRAGWGCRCWCRSRGRCCCCGRMCWPRASAAAVAVVELLVAMLNADVAPVVPEKGSVGASGDLAPLAHLALVAIGEGEAFYQGERMFGGEALRRAGLEPLALSAKEGLSLLNGTQAMTAVGALAVARAIRVAKLADLAGAMSLEALMGTPAAFDPRIHEARPHAGQIAAAAHLMELWRARRSARPIARATPGCRTPIACAACRRCMARCAARWSTCAECSRWKRGRQRTIRWCFRGGRRDTERLFQVGTSMARRWRTPSTTRRLQ